MTLAKSTKFSIKQDENNEKRKEKTEKDLILNINTKIPYKSKSNDIFNFIINYDENMTSELDNISEKKTTFESEEDSSSLVFFIFSLIVFSFSLILFMKKRKEIGSIN